MSSHLPPSDAITLWLWRHAIDGRDLPPIGDPGEYQAQRRHEDLSGKSVRAYQWRKQADEQLADWMKREPATVELGLTYGRYVVRLKPGARVPAGLVRGLVKPLPKKRAPSGLLRSSELRQLEFDLTMGRDTSRVLKLAPAYAAASARWRERPLAERSVDAVQSFKALRDAA